MRNDYNTARPLIMHIDLNSCFATVEQQARVRLRGRPVAIVNRRTEHTAIITASYEAKACGVKVGMRFRDAKKICPDIIMLESDPPKYRYVYHKLLKIMNDYSAHVRMKSIDEGVIDFSESTAQILGRDLKDVGMEIKHRLKTEIGEAMRCNVGLGTNRFLAKTAAGLHKPDGLDEVWAHDLRNMYGSLKLTDLTGIAHRNQARLNGLGIYTALEFLDAPVQVLEKQVFKSVCGVEWHQRLRGWEVDKRDFPLRTVGRQYVLEGGHLTRQQVLERLHHLAEETGAKLRSQRMAARGVAVYAKTYEREYWKARRILPLPFTSDRAIYEIAQQLMSGGAPTASLREIGVNCYELTEDTDRQLTLFGDALACERRLVSAIDTINNRFGRRTIHSAHTLETNNYIRQKIPFGSTRYL
ncbi:hypothetical protein FJZ39_03600 [Candidatus Saccharibacteria bacterium]|nr:hypothetical protein [Candidatus Saccharibacteria bacterium]